MNAIRIFSHLIFPEARNATRQIGRRIASWALGILAAVVVGIVAVPLIFVIGMSMPILRCVRLIRRRERPEKWTDWAALVPLSWPVFGLAFYGRAFRMAVSAVRMRQWMREGATSDPSVIPFSVRAQPSYETERLDRLEKAQ